MKSSRDGEGVVLVKLMSRSSSKLTDQVRCASAVGCDPGVASSKVCEGTLSASFMASCSYGRNFVALVLFVVLSLSFDGERMPSMVIVLVPGWRCFMKRVMSGS